MIKILKNGNLPKPKRYIYKTECKKCHCEFEFELEDCKMVEKKPNGLLVLECPCCYQNVTGKLDNLEYREEENE